MNVLHRLLVGLAVIIAGAVSAPVAQAAPHSLHPWNVRLTWVSTSEVRLSITCDTPSGQAHAHITTDQGVLLDSDVQCYGTPGTSTFPLRLMHPARRSVLTNVNVNLNDGTNKADAFYSAVIVKL